MLARHAESWRVFSLPVSIRGQPDRPGHVARRGQRFGVCAGYVNLGAQEANFGAYYRRTSPSTARRFRLRNRFYSTSSWPGEVCQDGAPQLLRWILTARAPPRNSWGKFPKWRCIAYGRKRMRRMRVKQLGILPRGRRILGTGRCWPLRRSRGDEERSRFLVSRF